MPPAASARVLEVEEALELARAEIARLASVLATVRARVLEEAEPEIVRLALAIAERVVGRELAADPRIVARWIEEGLASLPGPNEPTVAVAPDVAATLGEDASTRGAVLVDAALAPGSCELRDGPSVVAIGVRARLAALSDALGVDPVR